MIINFSVENWMSYRDEAHFSMVASREKQHMSRLPAIPKFRMKTLPIAAIYGGNASGKTNFFKALHFMKSLIVKGSRPDNLIPVMPFRLDDNSLEKPSRFKIEILIDELIYEYSFTVNGKNVLEEKLVTISSTKERILFHRINGESNFDKSLRNDETLKVFFNGTRDNQLFLTNTVSQKVETFAPVYYWFRDTLELVAPDSRFELFEQFLDEDHALFSSMNEMLPQLDTGINCLGGEEVPLDLVNMPEGLKTKLQETLKEGVTVRLMTQPINERVIVTRKNGKLVANKLMSFHTKDDGTKEKFDLRLESDGSQRVIDLLPAFLEIASPVSKKVYVIDELDRSLHTLLTRKLLETYLESCHPDSRSQLLFTTHDIQLMDQSLLRRDEMWVAERDQSGASSISSFSEFKDVRSDKDIQKSYLQGRLGGIPNLILNKIPGNANA